MLVLKSRYTAGEASRWEDIKTYVTAERSWCCSTHASSASIMTSRGRESKSLHTPRNPGSQLRRQGAAHSRAEPSVHRTSLNFCERLSKG